MVDADIDLVLERKEDGWWKFWAVELSVCLRFSDQLIHVEPACVGLQGDQYGFYEVSRLHQDANESHPKVESSGVYLPCFVAAKKTLAASDGQERLDVCIDQVAQETRICMELRDWTSCSCCMIHDTRCCCCCCRCRCRCRCCCCCCWWLMWLIVVVDCCCWLLLLIVVVDCCCWLLLLLLMLIVVVDCCCWLLLLIVVVDCCCWLLLLIVVVVDFFCWLLLLLLWLWFWLCLWLWLLVVVYLLLFLGCWLFVACCLCLCVCARFSYCPLAPETVNCESHQTWKVHVRYVSMPRISSSLVAGLVVGWFRLCFRGPVKDPYQWTYPGFIIVYT